MLMLSQYEQTGIFDPSNPTQRKREVYTGLPGGYGSFYWNKVAPSAQLQGASVGSPVVVTLLVGVLGALGGYFGWKKWGPGIKSKLHLSKK